MACEMNHPEWYKGSPMAPDMAENEPLVVFDVEAHQVANLRAEIKELFDMWEEDECSN